MAHDHDIGADRLQCAHRVDEGFALFHAAAARREVHDIGAQRFRCDFEAGPGASALFIEECDDRRPAQGGNLADGTGADLGHRLRRLHDELNVGPRKRIGVEEVLGGPTMHFRERWLRRRCGRPCGRRRYSSFEDAWFRHVPAPRPGRRPRLLHRAPRAARGRIGRARWGCFCPRNRAEWAARDGRDR